MSNITYGSTTKLFNLARQAATSNAKAKVRATTSNIYISDNKKGLKEFVTSERSSTAKSELLALILAAREEGGPVYGADAHRDAIDEVLDNFNAHIQSRRGSHTMHASELVQILSPITKLMKPPPALAPADVADILRKQPVTGTLSYGVFIDKNFKQFIADNHHAFLDRAFYDHQFTDTKVDTFAPPAMAALMLRAFHDQHITFETQYSLRRGLEPKGPLSADDKIMLEKTGLSVGNDVSAFAATNLIGVLDCKNAKFLLQMFHDQFVHPEGRHTINVADSSRRALRKQYDDTMAALNALEPEAPVPHKLVSGFLDSVIDKCCSNMIETKIRTGDVQAALDSAGYETT